MERYEQTKRSPITKELRDGMRRYRKFSDLEVQHVELDAERFEKLCDAIDAVHARLEQENDELGKTVYDMRREFDEWKHSIDTGWIRLPVDADGEPWHIGDRTESGQTIQAMGLNKHGWHFVGTVNEIDPSIHRHYHAPTVEDVLVEFGNRWHTALGVDVESKLIAEYAAKLRELVHALHWCKDFEQQKCYMCPLDGELYHRCDDIARELGIEVDG